MKSGSVARCLVHGVAKSKPKKAKYEAYGAKNYKYANLASSLDFSCDKTREE